MTRGNGGGHIHHDWSNMNFDGMTMPMNEVLSEILIFNAFLISAKLASREKNAFQSGVQVRVWLLNRVVAETQERPTQTQKDPVSLLFFSPTFW